MGARQSSYLVDAHQPQPQYQQHQPDAAEAEAAAGQGTALGRGGAHRPPPLNLSAPPAPAAASRRRAPICSALETVDLAATHPHSPVPSPAATGLVDVWIIAGQSNAVGDNSEDGTPIPPACQPLPGLVLSYDSSGTWRDAAPSIHKGVHGYSREPSSGPGIPFARTLVSLGLSGRVGLVPAAKGASNLFNDWRPGGGAGGGDLYGTMIARTKAALAAPLPGGGGARLRGMIWVQGEADAEEKVGPGPSEAYGANFAAFVQAVRRDLASYHAQLPILMGVMSLRKRDCFPHLPAVRRAQLAAGLPGLMRIDLAGYEFFEQYGGFHVHLTKDGAAALGAAMAHTYYSAVVRAGLPRRPGDAVASAAVHAFALASVGTGASSGGGAAPAAPAAPPPEAMVVAGAAAAPPPPPSAADSAAEAEAEAAADSGEEHAAGAKAAAIAVGEGPAEAEAAGRKGGRDGEGGREGEGAAVDAWRAREQDAEAASNNGAAGTCRSGVRGEAGEEETAEPGGGKAAGAAEVRGDGRRAAVAGVTGEGPVGAGSGSGVDPPADDSSGERQYK